MFLKRPPGTNWFYPYLSGLLHGHWDNHTIAQHQQNTPKAYACINYTNHLEWWYQQKTKQSTKSLHWCHNECDGISNHRPHDCLFRRLLRHRSKKTSKLCITGLCEGNSPVTSEFPSQRASNTGIASISWRHHLTYIFYGIHSSAKWYLDTLAVFFMIKKTRDSIRRIFFLRSENKLSH